MSNVLRALRRASILCTLLLLPISSFASFIITSTGQIQDANGAPFVMRGVNYPYTWFQSRPTQQDLAAIKATGSNTVRLVLSTGGQWARVNGPQVAQLIQWCKDLSMIAVLEVHDSTGWSEQTTAVPISNATAYWLSSDIRAAINGQENFVIINIANEPFGNNTSGVYTNDTATSIRALRSAGITHTLMIDGANWGQDWSGTMRTNAMTLWNADTLRNLIFSVHMYEVYQSLATVSAYMQAFDDMNLPLIVGEFGPINNGQFADSESVIAQAQARGLGYIGWSWSGNGGGGTGLDMTNNFDAASLTTWGNRIVNGTNGIRATSVPATVFPGGGDNLTVSPAALTFGSGAASLPVAVTANVSWTVSDNQTWITVAPVSGSNNGSFNVSVALNNSATARAGAVTVTGGGFTRTINVSQAGQPNDPVLNLSQTSLAFPSAASSSAVNVTANVSWTVTDNQTWLTVAPTSGSNNGSFTVSATANTATTARSGTVTVTGGGFTRTIAVTQAGQSTTTTLNVSATSLSLASTVSSGTFAITSNVSWAVTDDQTWITVSPTSGSNNATVTVNATSANTATTARTGTVTVTGGGLTRTVSVTQAGSGGTGGTCANPVTFSGNTGNFNTTGAVCYRTNANINGWGCFNFDGRTVTVGGVARTCGQMPLTRSADGYYYFAVTAGQFPWAGIYAW
ncbi:MAG TPA: cellulase family glycosylhydrolase [Steroidobacteraceae bacterium]|nr:cellulase family glycosylhydrolase [Steroidobacteraceae bacterium]